MRKLWQNVYDPGKRIHNIIGGSSNSHAQTVQPRIKSARLLRVF